MIFVGGTNTRKTNPRWRTAAILKNRKSAISPQRFDRSAQIGTLMHIGPQNTFISLKFQLLKIQDGGRRHLEKLKNGHVCATVRPIGTKFGLALRTGPAVKISWLPPGLDVRIRKVCSQEHISVITNSFLMILLSSSNSSIMGT